MAIHIQTKKPRLLKKDFFNRPTLLVAKELLGKLIVLHTKTDKKTLIITEVEAYDGPHDKASHAYRGMTERNKIMFDEGGCWYIYLIYGMYWMLNVTSGPKKYPAAILIRGGSTTDGTHINGPGKLTTYLKVNKTFNELPATKKTGLWIEDRGFPMYTSNIAAGKRIGVDYADEWAKKLYNFSIKLP